MTVHNFQVDALSEAHQLGLSWFEINKNRTVPFPAAIESGQLLATKAKGIYKPADWSHALSIRIMLKSDYKDGEFFKVEGSGWVCAYHQELNPRNLAKSENLYSNLALQNSLDDKVPIGILKQTQTQEDGGSEYKVIGLGAVIGKIDEYFVLCDLPTAKTLSAEQIIQHLVQHEAEKLLSNEANNVEPNPPPNDNYRRKIHIWSQIVRRQGQGLFRKQLLRAYQNKCCMTETSDVAVLDAAHITPYDGPSTSTLKNGLLLRTDLHTLFDLGLLGIEPITHSIHVHESITETLYRALHGKTLRLPSSEIDRPGLEYLERKWADYQSASPVSDESRTPLSAEDLPQ